MVADVASGATTLDTVVTAVEDMVVGSLDPGMQLPGEADIARRLNVSRLTVREALKVLAGRGLVELSRGRRAVVREPDGSVLSGYFAVAMRRDPHALLELCEIRESLEALAAGRAARTAGRVSLAAAGQALEQMAAALEVDGPKREQRFHDADVAFHEALALASGSRMLAFVLGGFEESLRRSFHASNAGRIARGGSYEDVVAAHRMVLDAVRAHDVGGAERAMRAHLRQVERDLKAAIRAATGGASP